jgi:hypothetical protein
MVVHPATAGLLGFDTDTAITTPIAAALKANNFDFAIRYLSRQSPQETDDLSSDELAIIINAGLAIGVVQHCPVAGWLPTGQVGASYGVAAAANALAIGLPLGMTLWLDFEETSPETSEAVAVAYINSWAQAVSAVGYEPGIYIGANQPLPSNVLFWRLILSRYWKSASIVPAIPYRGYCMSQALVTQPVQGISIDRDIVTGDTLGGFPSFCFPD